MCDFERVNIILNLVGYWNSDFVIKEFVIYECIL